MTEVQVNTRFRNALLMILTGFIIGWLFCEYVFHPGLAHPLIGTCEVTDVGVTVDNPREYAMTSSGMEERMISTSAAPTGWVLVDTFPLTTTKIMVKKLNDVCCESNINVIKRGLPPSIIKTYDVSADTYRVTLNSSGTWKVYMEKK